jgi:energy-coupling factor transporter ATP-binding protein EcfA2
VILKRVVIDGFGKLVGRGPFDFSSGLTLIAGPNESGKTTLAECIMRLLFGFPHQQFNFDLDRYRPWRSGAPYRARLEFELDDRHAFETTRDFADDVKTVTRALDTKEQIDAWGGGRKASPGQLVLNLSLEAYRAAAFIGPGELQSKDDADFGAVGERLAAVVGSAGDEGADAAMLALNNFATKDIGSEASRKTRFGTARADREQAELEWKQANERFRELKVTIEEHAAAIAAVDVLEASCRNAEFVVAATRLRALQHRSRLVDAAVSAVAEAEHDRNAISAASIAAGGRVQSAEEQAQAAAEIERAISIREIAIAGAASAYGRADGREPERAALRAQSDACRQAIAADELRTVQLGAQLDAATARAGDAPALDRAAVEQLEEQDVAVDAVESRARKLETDAAIARQMRRSTPMAFASVLLIALVTLVTGLFEHAALLTQGGIGALIAGLFMMVFYLSAAGKRAEKIRDAEAEAEKAGNVLARAQSDLVAACRAFDCGNVASVRARFSAQRDRGAIAAEMTALSQTLESRRAQLLSLEAQLEGIGALERDVLTGTTAAEAAAGTLAARLDAAGIATGSDMDARIAAFRELRRTAERAAPAETALANARTALAEALGSFDVDSLRAEIDHLTAGMQAATETTPAIIAAVDEMTAVAGRNDLGRRLGDARIRLAELKAILKGAKLPDIADLEERMEACQAEERRLATAARAALLAREMIEEVKIAVHKSYLPTMNAALGEALGAITSGKYVEAHLNPADFAVRLTSPERGGAVDPWELSSGTTEQVNLALRAATAQALGSGERVPMILDDALAHADPERAAAALALLANSSHRGIQTLFFTQRTDLVRFARGLPGVQVVDLGEESTPRTNSTAADSASTDLSEATGLGRSSG